MDGLFVFVRQNDEVYFIVSAALHRNNRLFTCELKTVMVKNGSQLHLRWVSRNCEWLENVTTTV